MQKTLLSQFVHLIRAYLLCCNKPATKLLEHAEHKHGCKIHFNYALNIELIPLVSRLAPKLIAILCNW